MSAPCIKRMSLIAAMASAVVLLALIQPVADNEIDDLFATSSDQPSQITPVADFASDPAHN